MKICERCRADEARCFPANVSLCYGCASALHVFDADHGMVGQAQEAGFFDDVPGPYSIGKKLGQDAKSSGAGETIQKTASAAGEIAKTVKVVAIIGAVGAAAWVGYALYKARKEAVGLQQGAQHAILAHPQLLGL